MNSLIFTVGLKLLLAIGTFAVFLTIFGLLSPKEKKEEREKKNKEEAQKAEEFRNNKDINREPIAKQPTEIKTDDDSFAKEEMKIKDEMDVQEISESLIESDDLIDEEFIFEAESRNAF